MGRLSDDDMTGISEHLPYCAKCSRTHETMRDLFFASELSFATAEVDPDYFFNLAGDLKSRFENRAMVRPRRFLTTTPAPLAVAWRFAESMALIFLLGVFVVVFEIRKDIANSSDAFPPAVPKQLMVWSNEKAKEGNFLWERVCLNAVIDGQMELYEELETRRRKRMPTERRGSTGANEEFEGLL